MSPLRCPCATGPANTYSTTEKKGRENLSRQTTRVVEICHAIKYTVCGPGWIVLSCSCELGVSHQLGLGIPALVRGPATGLGVNQQPTDYESAALPLRYGSYHSLKLIL